MYYHPRMLPAPARGPSDAIHTATLDVLIPVDGSPAADRAVRFVIGLHRRLAPLRVRLLNVQLPDALPHERGHGDPAARSEQALRSARTLLDEAGIACISESRSGYVAQAIAQYAKETACSAVVMGTRGMGSTDEVLGSIARQVIHLVDAPVTLVK